MGHFLYRRHFVLLLGMAAALVATSRWRPTLATYATFALYGAMHASALVVSLPTRLAFKKCLLFIPSAAGLSAVSALLGLYASHYVGSLPAVIGPTLVVALASGFGAVCYAVLIRGFWIPELSNSSVLAIACGCIAASLFVLVSGMVPKTVDGLWFAITWWFAFSMGLGYRDGRAV